MHPGSNNGLRAALRPAAHGVDGLGQTPAEFRQLVVDPRRHGTGRMASDETVSFHRSKGLCQYLWGHSPDAVP